MEKPRRISDIPYEIFLTWKHFIEAFKFIREKRLWDGFWKYGWATAILIILGVLVGLQFFSEFWNLLSGVWTGLKTSDASLVSTRFQDFLGGLFLVGSWKYIILILGEVLIFHLLRRTIELLGGAEQDASFSAFIQAQKRMFTVALFSWVMELLATIFISVGLSILGLQAIKPVLVFLVSAYFLGFAMTDNYFERLGISITASHKLNLNIIGVSLGIGLVLYVLFLIPLIGPILGTSVGAVAAALTLYYLEQKGSLLVKQETELENDLTNTKI
ncbi:MAG: hypothetical protein GYB31_05475 [Bacteroidetes bacterium]|nr:hypothetical protein [Bacteroidota bacterium]